MCPTLWTSTWYSFGLLEGHKTMISRDHIIFSGVGRYVFGSKKIKKTPRTHYFLTHLSPWRELCNTYALQFWWLLKSVIKNQNISYLQSNNRILLIPHHQMFIILNQVKAKVKLLLQVQKVRLKKQVRQKMNKILRRSMKVSKKC